MGNIADCYSVTKDDHAWKKQNRETASNPVYSYVNLDGTGKLLDLFREENGREKVRGVIAKEIRREYINDQDTPQQCWKKDKRGGVGETPLHLCFLKGTPEHLEIARIFLKVYPSMANDVYLEDEYRGESGLHLAIEKGNLTAVKLLVENGANVNQRATGKFFQPKDVKQGKDRKKTNYKGYAYYGEYPLSFAAFFQHTDIYDYLIEHGANPNNKDEFGNTVLHMAVIYNQPKIYRHAVKHTLKKAVESKNEAGLTPLILSCKLGRPEIFEEILELRSTRVRKYGNIICSLYPLNDVDSIGRNGKHDWGSALMTILDGETDEHAEMLEGPVMSKLLKEKWKHYAKSWYFFKMFIALGLLILINLHIHDIPKKIYYSLIQVIFLLKDEHDDTPKGKLWDMMIGLMALLLALFCFFGLIEENAVAFRLGLWSYLRKCKYAPDNTIYTLSCVLILISIPLRFTGSGDAEETLLIIAVPGTFCILLFFARGFETTGPFVIMVYKMLTRDMVRFVIVGLFSCVGFILGFSLLYRDIEDQSISPTNFRENQLFAIERFTTWHDTLFTMFHMAFGEFEYEVFNEARNPDLTKVIFTAFVILMHILLLNMFIAMMGKTYHNIRVKSEKEWRKQRARNIVVLEAFSPAWKLLYCRYKYSDEWLMLVERTESTMAIARRPSELEATGQRGVFLNKNQSVIDN